MSLDSAQIRTFNDLGEAFIKQYKYNVEMEPDRDQLRAMSQKDKESFKEYAQRWREVAAQICPPLEEKEMTKIFLKTLSSFYYERMIASAPNEFTEMVNMGMWLEEAVREGRLTKEVGSSSNVKKFGSGFIKKKEHEVNVVLRDRQRRRYQPHHVATFSPIINPSVQLQPINHSFVNNLLNNLVNNINNLNNRLTHSSTTIIVSKEHPILILFQCHMQICSRLC